MSKKSILIVDDDPIVMEVAKERLEGLGFEVFTMEGPFGTTRWILANQPDFVLLDVHMPALGGTELAHLLAKRGSKSNVILFSSTPQAELDALARRVGACAAISKAASAVEFERRIQTITRRQARCMPEDE